MPRALKNLAIPLGLATIPVQLFTATSSKGVTFHLLHAKCGSRTMCVWSAPSTVSSVRREASLGRKELAKAAPTKADVKVTSTKRPTRQRHAS
jgi:DNA end-binding protein Ku